MQKEGLAFSPTNFGQEQIKIALFHVDVRGAPCFGSAQDRLTFGPCLSVLSREDVDSPQVDTNHGTLRRPRHCRLQAFFLHHPITSCCQEVAEDLGLVLDHDLHGHHPGHCHHFVFPVQLRRHAKSAAWEERLLHPAGDDEDV